MKAAKALRETSRWCSTSNSVATAKKFTQYDLVKKSWCNCNEISTTLLNIRLFLGFILCSRLVSGLSFAIKISINQEKRTMCSQLLYLAD